MATYTPNLNLKKPSTGERYDVIGDLNDAKDKIDLEIGIIRAQNDNFRKDKITISELIRKYPVYPWLEALNYKTLVINQDVTKAGVYVIPHGQHIIFENNAVLTQGDNLQCLAGDYDNWSISGIGTIRRSGGNPTAKIAGSFGIKIPATGFDWSIIGNIRIEHFADAGILFDGEGVITGRTGYTQVAGLHCHQNWDNYKFMSGFPVEYLSLSNCRSTFASNDGVYEETGNINWIGGTIAFNAGGVHLKHPENGANPHHGMFVGTHVNHNTAFQLWAEKVAFGYDFNGCHFYDNDNEAIGRIKLDNCRGINITGGTIGCNIEYLNDAHAHVGYNRIAGNKIDRNRAVMTGVGLDRTKLFVGDNFDISGTWKYNDVAKAYAQKYSGADVPLTGEPVYNLFAIGSELSDNRNAMGATYIAPFNGNFITSLLARMVSSQAITTEYLTFERDDAASGSFTELFRINLADIANNAGTSININLLYEFIVSKGGQVIIYLRGANPAATYTIKTGALLTVKTNN